MSYLPLEQYGIVGDMRTAALVSTQGSIDWFCLPRFDSPSVFAALLDDQKGGAFRIAPASECSTRQYYLPATNVLVTRYLSEQGVVELRDFMSVPVTEGSPSRLVRRVTATRGELTLNMHCGPAFDYARQSCEMSVGDRWAVFCSSDLKLALSADVPLQQGERGTSANFTLREGESAVFLLRQLGGDERPDIDDLAQLARQLECRTTDFWRGWLSQCTYAGRWREAVHRSALTLKLLTFQPTGAIIAAPTTSLPDRIGGGRNWDFRYTWIRDAAFTVYALLRLGFSSEALDFVQWLDARYHESMQRRGDSPNGPLQVVYRVDGGRELEEIELDHLAGYRNSRPVRIGNDAAHSFQLDIYGELIDSVYLYNKHGACLSHESWTVLRSLVDWLCDNWQRPDQGIWEIRGDSRHFVYSKAMCWVAIDRALRVARSRSFPADENRWRSTRNQIYEEVLERGWSDDRQSMVQAYEGECLDGSLLMLPLVFFLTPDDPRMKATLRAIRRPYDRDGLVADGMVHRYPIRQQCSDGIGGGEGAFNICTFWLIEVLARSGKFDPELLDEAWKLFEQMLGTGNHLGLFAEQTGRDGEALGNFPIALTHLGLVSAAFDLDRALDTR